MERATYYTKNELELFIGCYFTQDDFNDILKLTNFHVIMKHNNVRLPIRRPDFYLIGTHASMSCNQFFSRFTLKKRWSQLYEYDHLLINRFDEAQRALYLAYPELGQNDIKTYDLEELPLDRTIMRNLERWGEVN